jgi:putative heme-binding domain-containing protein
MLEDDDSGLLEKVASFWTAASSPSEDMHYLIVFSRLRANWDAHLRRRVVHTLLCLHRKLEGKEQRVKQVWNDRLSELLTLFLRRDPLITKDLIQHPEFVSAGHVGLALVLAKDFRKQAARLFLEKVRQDPEFPWSDSLIELLGQLPLAQTVSAFRSQWSNFALRDAIVLRLAEVPEPMDREKFQTGLESGQHQVTLVSLKALASLPPDGSAQNVAPLLRFLRRLEQEPKERELRQQTVAALGRQVGRRFTTQEKESDFGSLKRDYAPIFEWIEEHHPAAAAALREGTNDDPAKWSRLLKRVEWSQGNPARGEKLFRDRACETCHAGARALGPDLAGVASRLSREDLFTAIVDPSRDVAPAYRTTAVETRDGQVHTGIIIFESADGLIVQTGAATTIRLATADIVSRFPSNRSLMPDGLLRDLKPADVADLYSYLQSLKPANSPPGRAE